MALNQRKGKLKKSVSTSKKLSNAKNFRIPSKKIVVADLATEKKVLVTRTEPEFKDKVVIHDDGHAALKSEQVFMCDEPGCNLLFSNEEFLRRHLTHHNFDIRIKCKFCGICFKTTNDKTEHLEEFHPDLEVTPEANPLQCKKCSTIWPSAFKLGRHIRRAHKTQKHQCLDCGSEYKHLEDLRQHQLRKHVKEGVSTPTYPCEICGWSSNYRSDWRKHIWKHHRNEDKEYKCVLCNIGFHCKRTYQNHLIRHTRHRSFSCDLCNYHFPRQFELRRHLETLRHKSIFAKYQMKRTKEGIKFSLKNVFPETKTLEEFKQMKTEELIQFCSQRIPKIILHRVDNKIKVNYCAKPPSRKKYQREKIYLKCVYCHQAFPSLTQVNQHEKLCRNEKTNKMHTCTICNKSFKRPHQLTSHSIIHSTERPYKCHYCETFFKRKDIRLKHEKNFHFGIKTATQLTESNRTFTCSYKGCAKKFRLQRSLNRHVQVKHLGVKFPCKDCEKVYSRKEHLTIHEQKKHAKKPELILECKPCNKIFVHKTLYHVHSKGVRHINKMKEFTKEKSCLK